MKSHSQLAYYHKSLQLAKTVVETPATRLDVMTNADLQAGLATNEHIFRQLVRAILFLAKQGLPLRGDKEENFWSFELQSGQLSSIIKVTF